MHDIARYLQIGICAGGSLLAQSARAQEPPVPERGERAAQILAALGERVHDERVMGALSGIGLGLAATGTGLLVDLEYDISWGETVWIVGGVNVVSGILSLFNDTPIEEFAAEWHAGSSEALETAWRDKAEGERAGRQAFGVICLGIGVVSMGGGAAVVAGVGDLERHDRAEWSALAFIGGGAFVTLGALTLTMKGNFEQGYELAYPSAPSVPQLNVGFAPTPGGGALRLGGQF